jgi:glycolate oxidase FAD binding subunit
VLSGLRDVLTVAEELGAGVRGSAGTGVVYAAIADPERAPAAVSRVREVCAKHQGAAVVLDAPAGVKQAVDVWGPVPSLDLMRRVKDQFDPDHRLAPGRFAGGI